MCNNRLWAVSNLTNVGALLTSTNGIGDTCSVHANGTTPTGGVNHNFIEIPDCSGQQYYTGHHILIRAADQSWTVSLWSNDPENCALYWNSANAWSDTATLLAGSGDDSTITIGYTPRGGVTVDRWPRVQ